MSVRILWLSRSASPMLSQIADLKLRYGDDLVIVRSDPTSAEEAIEKFDQGGFRDVVAVMPLSVLDHICKAGLRPLYPEVVETDPGKGEWIARGRSYHFAGFRRVKAVCLDLAPVTPEKKLKLLWCTDNRITPEQLSRLREFFGAELKYRKVRGPWPDGAAIAQIFRESGADDLMVMASYGHLDQLTRGGIYPLFPEFKNEEFVDFRRLFGIRLEFAD